MPTCAQLLAIRALRGHRSITTCNEHVAKVVNIAAASSTRLAVAPTPAPPPTSKRPRYCATQVHISNVSCTSLRRTLLHGACRACSCTQRRYHVSFSSCDAHGRLVSSTKQSGNSDTTGELHNVSGGCASVKDSVANHDDGEGKASICKQTRTTDVHARDCKGKHATTTTTTTAAAAHLRQVACDELRAEVARDGSDGFAAVPPLAPPGWSVHHTPGAGFFYMIRLCPGVLQDDDGSAIIGRSGAVMNTAATAVAAAVSRYRSIHDEHSSNRQGRFRTTAHSHQAHGCIPLPAHTHASSACATRQEGVAGGDAQHVKRLHSTTQATRLHARHAIARTRATDNVHAIIFAPFRVRDVSMHESDVSICEWATFDVLVRKKCAYRTRGMAADANAASLPRMSTSNDQHELQGKQCQALDESRALYLRLASVNGELRLRYVQFLSRRLANALVQQVAFGRGDPVYMEVLRRHHAATAATTKRSTWCDDIKSNFVIRLACHGAVNTSISSDGDETTSNHHSLDYKLPRDTVMPCDNLAQPRANTAAMTVTEVPCGAPVGLVTSHEHTNCDSEALLMRCFDSAGDVARAMVYPGPYLTDLSMEMYEELLRYVIVCVGINADVAEYICQMQYYLEQEEYMRWLARCAHLAKKTR